MAIFIKMFYPLMKLNLIVNNYAFIKNIQI